MRGHRSWYFGGNRSTHTPGGSMRWSSMEIILMSSVSGTNASLAWRSPQLEPDQPVVGRAADSPLADGFGISGHEASECGGIMGVRRDAGALGCAGDDVPLHGRAVTPVLHGVRLDGRGPVGMFE